MWPVLMVLLAISGFYIFLSLYLLVHILSGYFLGGKARQ